MGLFGLFGKKKMTLGDADKINDKAIAGSSAADNETQRMRDASKALTSGKFDDAITAYQSLADDYPNNSSRYLGQVGAAWFFKGDYNKAIEFYTKAMENDKDGHMDDNIWEATEELYKQNKDTAVVENYLKLYPNGSHKKKAEKLLQ